MTEEQERLRMKVALIIAMGETPADMTEEILALPELGVKADKQEYNSGRTSYPGEAMNKAGWFKLVEKEIL